MLEEAIEVIRLLLAGRRADPHAGGTYNGRPRHAVHATPSMPIPIAVAAARPIRRGSWPAAWATGSSPTEPNEETVQHYRAGRPATGPLSRAGPDLLGRRPKPEAKETVFRLLAPQRPSAARSNTELPRAVRPSDAVAEESHHRDGCRGRAVRARSGADPRGHRARGSGQVSIGSRSTRWAPTRPGSSVSGSRSYRPKLG
jgi:hypothetical protein